MVRFNKKKSGVRGIHTLVFGAKTRKSASSLRENCKSNVIGIDLGTANSCVAVIKGGELVVIPNAEGSRTTPSIVSMNKNGERLVGEVARRQAVTNPENTISSIKRFMGRKFDDPETDRDKGRVSYKVVRANHGDAWVEILRKQYSPSEISAMILQKLKTDAEAYLGERVTQVVITVPAYFNDAQRQATKDAGRIAGLEVLRIVNEPTAAALAYGLGRKGDKRIAVYDFGDDTFDISILELGDGVFEVKSTNGDAHLGGNDFDQRIINWLSDEFCRESGIDLRQDRMALQRLKLAAENAKKELYSSMTTEINLPFITADANGPKHINITLTRTKLEQLVEELIEKSCMLVTKALSDADIRPNEIDEVVLVGSQTSMPAIQALVKRIFEREPNRGMNPDEVVAMGAAIQADVLTGNEKDAFLLDVIPLSLGIETVGGVFTRLIERNTIFPTQKSQVFSTISDNQPNMEIKVLQGEREFAKDNRVLGNFILDGIRPAPRGIPQIEVTFDIDANGIVNVSARDKGTGRQQKITIAAFNGLSEGQINQMVRDAEKHAARGKMHKEEIEERNLVDNAAYQTEKSSNEQGDKLTPGQRGEPDIREEQDEDCGTQETAELNTQNGAVPPCETTADDKEKRNLADNAAYQTEKSSNEQDDKLTSEQKSELLAKIADSREEQDKDCDTQEIAGINIRNEVVSQGETTAGNEKETRPSITAPAMKIFMCYARKDEELRQELEKHLRGLKRQGLITIWHDRDISPGTEWESEIDIHLSEAQIILLLVSPDFIDSDYCYGIEMKRAIEKHNRKEAIVIPIILRHVHWDRTPFGKFQALPKDAKPVQDRRSWNDLDEALFSVAEGIRTAVEKQAHMIRESGEE